MGRFKFTYDQNGLIVCREEMGLFRSILKIEPSQSDLFRFCEEAEDLYIYMAVSKPSANVKSRKGIFRAYEIVTMRESTDLVGFFFLLLYLNDHREQKWCPLLHFYFSAGVFH